MGALGDLFEDNEGPDNGGGQGPWGETADVWGIQPADSASNVNVNGGGAWVESAATTTAAAISTAATSSTAAAINIINSNSINNSRKGESKLKLKREPPVEWTRAMQLLTLLPRLCKGTCSRCVSPFALTHVHPCSL